MIALADLILLRLLAPERGREGVARSRVAGDLRPLWPGSDGAAPWPEAFAAAWRGLTDTGHAATGGRGAGRLVATPVGAARAREVFGLPEDFPVSPGWAALRDGYALPRALGTGTAAAGGDKKAADRLRAALLRRFLLDGARGADSLRGAVDLLLARALVVPRPSLAEFRRAALRRALIPGEPSSSGTARPEKPASVAGGGAVRLPEDLSAFATLVRETARGVPTGRFGESKIFLVHVWRALLAAGRAGPDEETVFKERVAASHAAGLLGLARADLTGAFDPADLAGSEVRFLNATFHFLRLDQP